MLINTDLKIRAFQWSDIPAIANLNNLSEQYDQLEGRTTVAELENDWRSPLYSPEQECVMVHAPDEALIAWGFTEASTIPNRGWGGAVVHPQYRRQGIGTRLLRMTDDNFLHRRAGEVDAETPIYVQRWTPEIKQDAIEVLEKEGYQRVRTFYTMRIELDQPLAPAVMPEGLTLKPFNPETDTRKVYEAQQESFRDHWGWVADVPFEDWQTRLTEPNFDPSMWYIAYEGDEIAGVSMCILWGEDIPDLAWVGTLGVRRPWRKRGLGLALLQHSFYDFQQRGFKKAGLGVDASSPTNAVALYERAGMHIHKRGFSYRKVLRGNPELIKE